MLVVFDHAGACAEGMPKGTRMIFSADISSAFGGTKPTKVAHARACDSAGDCQPVSDATVTFDADETAGVATYVWKGAAKRVAFVALDCATHADNTICG